MWWQEVMVNIKTIHNMYMYVSKTKWTLSFILQKTINASPILRWRCCEKNVASAAKSLVIPSGQVLSHSLHWIHQQ